MKKLLIVFLAAALLFGAVRWVVSTIKETKKNVLATGSNPEDFTLAIKDSAPFRLNGLLGKYTIVLAFLDTSANSAKFTELFAEKISREVKSRPGVAWFDIKKDGAYAVIEERSGKLPVLYRAPYKDIPPFYKFNIIPSFLVIDRNGVIKLIYSGYSPTAAADILDSLPSGSK
jgi:cytochrome oxidase Cu insertion factor (SCO1/SenC/PrrC family)